MNKNGNTAVIVIDLQKCFLPGGSLATDIKNADDGLQLSINTTHFIQNLNPDFLFISLDWHPEGHISFGTVEDIKKSDYPGQLTKPAYNNVKPRLWSDGRSPEEHKMQKLWPPHCIQNNANDSGVAENFNIDDIKKKSPNINIKYVLKGFDKDIDSYSVVADAIGEPTPFIYNGSYDSLFNPKLKLDLNKNEIFLSTLKVSNINKVYLTGIARDVCVFWSAMDLLQYWILPAYCNENKTIKLFFVYDLTRPVDSSVKGLDISKDTINDSVKKLINTYINKINNNNKNNYNVDTIFESIFAIEDSSFFINKYGIRSNVNVGGGSISGGRSRRARKLNKSRKTRKHIKKSNKKKHISIKKTIKK